MRNSILLTTLLLLFSFVTIGQTPKKKLLKRPERVHFNQLMKNWNPATPNNKGIELSIKISPETKDHKESVVLIAKNTNKTIVTLYAPIDGSFWGFTSPKIFFNVEEWTNDSWKTIDYHVPFRCGNHSYWRKDKNQINIEPNETKEIGFFNFARRGLGGWFSIYGHKKLRISAEYIINQNDDGVQMHLISTPLIINYHNFYHPVDFPKFIDNLKLNNEFTKSKIKQRAKVIKFPGSNQKRLNIALKKWGLNPNKNTIKSEHMFKTTDKEKTFPFQGLVIENNNKYYLIIFARLTRFGLEKSYQSDYCKLYKIN